MKIRVLVNGCHGKMGQLTVKTLTTNPAFTVVAALGHNDNLAETIKKLAPQVVVDFTNAAAVHQNIETIIAAGVHPVIGTSGLLNNQIVTLQERCAQLKLGGIIAPNFSLGAVLMMKYAAEIAKYYNNIEIIEMHHAGKLDSPSGTALRTAEMLAATRTTEPAKLKDTRETIPGARGANYQDIPIHAVRLPGIVAGQQIIFGGSGETLTIKHDTIDRQCFMPGVELACQKVLTLDHLVYGLEELI
jgi:4-hydroxy-tetrahydrodipicolinate reductase